MNHPEIVPLSVTGSPYERGLATSRAGHSLKAEVRHRIALAESFLAGEEEWLRRQWQCQLTHVPDVCEQIEGLAAGFDVTVEALFGMHIRYAIEDRRTAAAAEEEGCSAFAVRSAPGRVLVSKNRDNPPYFAPLQLLLRQSDPAWAGRETVAVGSFGSAPAASSGMNSDGFCMADTAVRTADLGFGVLRYYLMEALLSRCRTVADAVAFIRSVPHVGGGNLILGDATGAMAAVEIVHSRVHVEEDAGRGWVARTNHHTEPDLARRLMERLGTDRPQNSEGRLAFLQESLAPGVAGWTETDCAALLASHGLRGHPALCRHTPDTITLSGVVFDAAGRSLLQSQGSPCGGDWRRVHLASGGKAASSDRARDSVHG